MNRKGNVTLYIAFLFIAVIIITIGALVGPLGTLFTTEMILAGEDILGQANESIANINDATIRESIYATVASANAAAETNIEVSAGLFQWSWLLLLIVAVLVIFLITRQTVEVGGGGLA